MYRSSSLMPILVLGATSLSAACSGESAAERPQTLGPLRDACELLPASEVEAIVGQPVQAESLGASPVEFQSYCGYLDTAGEDVFLETHVTWSGGTAAAQQIVAENQANLEPIEGVGDGAWLSTYVGQHSLLVDGDVLVTFHTALLPGAASQMMGDHSDLRRDFEAIARSVLSRL